jgi:hypothetical protein
MNPAQLLSRWSDSYDREARLYPALLTLLPLVLLLVCVFGARHPVLVGVLSTLIACGGPLLLARLARDRGKALEDRLIGTWGGKPTTIILRHQDDTIDALTKKKYHEVLGKALSALPPTPESEKQDLATADTFYRAATAWLISQTQDTKKHALVFKENKNYGFQRNLCGMKSAGVLMSIVAVLGSAAHTFFSLHIANVTDLPKLTDATIVDILPISFSLLMFLCWCFLVTENSVKRSGYAYGDRLLRTCNVLKPKAVVKKSLENNN